MNKILLSLDPYLFKNAADAGIPMTDGERGIKLAAVLGMFGNPRKGLQILDSVSKEHLKMARELERFVHIQIKSKWEKAVIYAEAKIEMKKDVWGRAIVQHEHDKIVLVESNKRCFFKGNASERESTQKHMKAFKNLTIDDLIDYVANLPNEIKTIVERGIELVKDISEEGLKKPLGIGVGHVLRENDSDTKTLVKARTASAIDARMFGSSRPSIVVAGSGNQGIVATMPIYVYAKKNKMDEDLLTRSVALSYLVTIYMSYHSSYLCAICGLGFKAGVGSSAGLAYYMSSGNKKVVKRAIQNFIANLPGMICDGGKYSCALKGATASDAIYQSALLASKNKEPPYRNGILGKNVEDSIKNLGEIIKAAQPLNKIIVRILFDKQA